MARHRRACGTLRWVDRITVSDPPLLTISSGRGGISRAGLRELWTFRQVLSAFVTRRIKVRYKQAAFGLAWVVLQPLAIAAIFALFLGRIARFPSDGAPYFLFVFTGLTLWTYFAQTLSGAADCLVSEAGMLRKVYFPREIPPLSVVIAALVDLAIGFLILFGAVQLFGRTPNIYWLFLPIPAAIVVVTATAFGLILAGLNVYYRDIILGLPFVIQTGLFASPVIYSTSLIPGAIRPFYEVFNPIAAGIQALRDITLGAHQPDFVILGLALAWALVLVVVAYAAFKMIERRFADVV
jgi:lipopolysaccharide transport system permease protein